MTTPRKILHFGAGNGIKFTLAFNHDSARNHSLLDLATPVTGTPEDRMLSPLPEKTLRTILAGLAEQESFVFLETSRTTPDNRYSYLFLNPVATLSCTTDCSALEFLHTAQTYLDQGFYLAGWFAYEFGYALEPVLHRYLKSATRKQPCSLATLGVFPKPILYDHASHCFSQELPFPAADISPLQQADSFKLSGLTPDMERERYITNLNRIREYIEAGDTYQVNYTLRLLFDFSGSPEAFYRSLRNNQPVSHSAYLKLDSDRILSFSPELFFRKTDSACTVKPMKGTLSRGRTLTEDCLQAALLQQDPKNRSENVMIVDLLRNDLGRLSQAGSVAMDSMFDVETYATLHQMTSTISSRLKEGVDLATLFQALFPCGSVTGAPKIRTMEIINELEPTPRGVYTGGIGFLSPQGEAQFNVPIRTVVLGNGKGEMGIGSGIVYDSDPESEWQECLLKGRFLTNPVPDFQIIETMLAEPGSGIWLLDLHMARLSDSATYFAFPMEHGRIRRHLQEAADQCSNGHAMIRLLLFRDGHYETSCTPCEAPTLRDFPPAANPSEAKLPQIKISELQTVSTSPLLFHKTTNRAMYNDELKKAREQGFHEVIFCNEKEELTEGSITNVFIQSGEFYYTPPLTCGLLPGIFRRHLLQSHPQSIIEKKLTLHDLKKATAIYIANSVRGLIKVQL